MSVVPVTAIIASGAGFSKFIILAVGIKRCYDGWDRNIHREDAETLRNTKAKAKFESAEVAEDVARQRRNQRDIHHGGTETRRKSKSKARPESTEVAEATERSAGAMGRGHTNPKVLP
jgi:hypothetical protein